MTVSTFEHAPKLAAKPGDGKASGDGTSTDKDSP
jgi:hypothetical protein